ncbi:alpha amylase C-terminal domain-containing protein, partial [uncultured Winogradskyella sp.]|uniref:alpha amylase C-terminal domain-containing protein n=1 Tax=uncultured Winogradskyella sp. TaxID=395353 RepID=UPI00261260F5
RKGNNSENDLVIACNMTPVPRENYKMGVPRKGKLKEVFNSDLKKYFGSGSYKNKMQSTKEVPWQFRDNSIEIDIPPLGMVAFKYATTKSLK